MSGMATGWSDGAGVGAAGSRPRDVVNSVNGFLRGAALSSAGDKPSEVVAWGVRYVAANFNREITLDDVAGGMDLSKFHFLRRFRDEGGMTPGQFLRCYRMMTAMERLAGSDRKVREIAREVGYRDAASFSRAFRRVTGTQPNCFRRYRRKAAAGVGA